MTKPDTPSTIAELKAIRAQVKAIRRDIFAGRLPADSSSHEVALAQARQDSQNLPKELIYLVPFFAAITLLGLGVGIMPSPTVPPVIAFGFAIAAVTFGAYLVIVRLRAARNCRRLLAAAEAPPAQ